MANTLVLTGLDGVTVDENDVNANPSLIDGDVTVTSSAATFRGAILVVSGLLAEDRVSIASDDHVSLVGGVVWYDADGFGGAAAVAIGTATGGLGADLVVTFDSDASLTAVEAVIESLTYANTSDSPTAGRTLTYQLSDSSSPDFVARTGEANPFGVLLGTAIAPALADLDGDGDLDAVVLVLEDTPLYLENTGSASNPQFTQRTGADNPFESVLGFFLPRASFADMDGDGDLDLVIGEIYGGLNYFENTGSASSAEFTWQSSGDNPLDLINGGYASAPVLVDLDSDGDFDAVIGSLYGPVSYFENTGSASEAVFVERTGGDNPFDAVYGVDFYSTPTFADMDRDGDLDLVIGGISGRLNYFENTGSASVPVFTQRTGAANLFDGVHVGLYSTPVLADLDGDGDLDVLIGGDDGSTGTLNYFENMAVDGPPTLHIIVNAQADAITGTEAGELITGTADDETLNGLGGDDTLQGGGGSNILDGGLGTDIADYSLAAGAVTANLATRTASVGADTDSFVSIEGLLGSDFNDDLTGHAGVNRLDGGAGADRMVGGAGSDFYYVDDAGDEVIEAADVGRDVVFTKIDFTLEIGQSIEILRANAGATGLVLTGNELDNMIYGGDGSDVLIGGDGNDWLEGGAGADILRGGDGSDRYVVDNAGDQVLEIVGFGTDQVYARVDYALADGESIEVLKADAGATGLALTGNNLDNRIYGAAGDDVLTGGGGVDCLDGGAGADSLTGGVGSDIYFVDDSDDDVFELTGQGTDSVYARSSYSLTAGQSLERLYAHAGNTGLTLTGNEIANSLFGAGGADRLDGGAGRDQMTGGAGADRFVFSAVTDTGRTSSSADRILDFSVGTDLIDLSALDAIAGGSDNAFSFIGTDGFSRTSGELRVMTQGGFTRVIGDVNGDGVADFVVVLLGVHSLTASDFVL